MLQRSWRSSSDPAVGTTTIIVICASAAAGVCGTLCYGLLPSVLAAIATWRQHHSSKSSQTPCCRSALYSGRVWHTRLRPVHHAFQYPLFIFCLDLQEVQNGVISNLLWPLTWICQFHPANHLKNGEGGSSSSTTTTKPLIDRVLSLVEQKSKQSFSKDTHCVLLITHLTYYGYCFNPVSFFIIQDRSTDRIQAVVGEVSNTPWNEMHCYVLHPESVDTTRVIMEQQRKRGDESGGDETRYIFPKQFHVSPFMEMEYDYDWTFRDIKGGSPIVITNSLRRRDAASTLQFYAKMQVKRRSLHPFCIAWHMTAYPVYCAMIQVWIHYEAFWLFVKGVPYQPHPQGSETTASKIIGNVMAPLFKVQDWWKNASAGGCTHDRPTRSSV